MHRHTKHFFGATLVVSVLSLSAFNSAALAKSRAQGNIIVDGKPISLRLEHMQRLKKVQKLGVTVVYPAYLPQRFHLNSVNLADEEPTHPDYVLTFHDNKKNEFVVESAYTGIGDGPDGDRNLKGNSKTFGEFTISVYKPGSEGNATKTTYYLSSWMEDQKRKDTRGKEGDALKGRYYHFLGSGVTDKEAIDIVQSLKPIK